MSETETTTVKDEPNGSKRKVVWHTFRALGLLIVLPILFVFIAVVLMFDRDITAPSWVKNAVSERAAQTLAGGAIEFGAINVNVGRDLHPRLRLTDTVLRDANGAILANVEEISGLLSPRGLVYERAALVQEVVLSGLELTLRRSETGEVDVSFDNITGSTTTAPDFLSLISQFDAIFERPELVALERLDVEDLAIEYSDARSDQIWRVSQGAATLDLRGEDVEASADLPIVQTSGETGVASFLLRQHKGTQRADLTISVKDVRAKDLAPQSAAISFLSRVDAPLSMSLQMALDEDGVVSPMQGDISLETGEIGFGPDGSGLAFQTARAALLYDPTAQVITFEEVSLSSDWGAFEATGQSLLGAFEGGTPTQIVSQLELANVSLTPPGVFAEPKRIEAASADLRVTFDPFHIELGQLVIHDNHQPLEVTGKISGTDQGLFADIDFEVPRIDHKDLRYWWPEGQKVGTREWLTDNVISGTLVDLIGGVRLRPERAAMFSVGFQFEDTTVRYLEKLPPIQNGSGYASFLNSAFFLSVDEGQIQAPQGGVIDVSGSDLEIRDLQVKGGPIDLNIRGSSSITAALSTLDLPPFEFMQKANLPVTIADGLAEFEGLVTFPLKKVPTRQDVAFAFDADLRRVDSQNLIPGRPLTAPALGLEVNTDKIELDGRVIVDGVPLTATYLQTFGPDGGRSVDGEVALSQQFLDGFNIALPPGTLRGQGVGQFEIDLPPNAPPEFALTSDLRGLGVTIPSLNWSMSERSSGELALAGRFETPLRLDRLELSGPGLDLEGTVSMSPSGGFGSARFSKIRVGNWFNAPVIVRGRGTGRPASIQIDGGNLDLRQASFGTTQTRSGPMSLNLNRLQVSEGIALTDFTGNFDEGVGLNGQFSALINGQAQIRGTLVPQNGRTAMRLQTDDAGAAAAAAGLMKNGVGGVLDLTVTPNRNDGVFDGVLRIERLRVRDAPAMAALLDAISVVGLLQQLDGQGLAFEEVDARFRLTPTQLILSEASAVGPGLGISIDGIYTLANSTMDFQGVISPIYLLNGIGSILTRKGEGLIGFNFNLTGQTDNPNVSVNPLSALTPGMFRELFRRPAPQITQ